MTLTEAIHFIDTQTPDKQAGLPDEVFYFISRTTPLMNVDLLVKDDDGRTLLSWRDDAYCGMGWHIPGGIVRFQETLAERIQKTALNELGTKVQFIPKPIHIHEFILPEQRDRGHFISFLYACRLPIGYEPDNGTLAENDVGFLKWHRGCPGDLLPFHEVYRDFIEEEAPFGHILPY